MIYFLDNIKYLLESNNMRQSELARKMNVTRQEINKMLQFNNPKANTLIAISDIFKISIDDLLRIDLKNQK